MDAPDIPWFYSYFLALCIRKTDNEWQRFVTDIMHARHGGQFVQVDPSFHGDKGCDGYVNGLMLACYGASRPTSAGVKDKIESDLKKAKLAWPISMRRWAFVHNNATGLPLAAAQAIIDLQALEEPNGLEVEQWPPQTLWHEGVKDLSQQDLITLIGAPPTSRPAQMTYIAEAIRAVARTPLVAISGQTLPVPEGKIEYNDFQAATAELIRQYQIHTHLVRYYFEHGTPGEQFQVAENLRARYDGLVAAGLSPDGVFHALCDELISEAFATAHAATIEEQRSAALLVVTHFFESCLIFEAPEEAKSVLA